MLLTPLLVTQSQRSTAQVTEEEAWNNFLQSLKSSKWLQQPQHHQEHHRADHSSAAAAPRPSSLSPQPLAPPPRPSHQAQPPTDRPPLMSLRDLASRLGLAQQRVPVGPDVNTSKGEEAVVKPPNGSEAPAAPSPAAPADYPTPQSPVSRRLHLHHTAPPPDAGCQATAPDPTAPQTHHDRRLSQGSSLGIKRPRSPAEQREGSSSRRKEVSDRPPSLCALQTKTKAQLTGGRGPAGLTWTGPTCFQSFRPTTHRIHFTFLLFH